MRKFGFEEPESVLGVSGLCERAAGRLPEGDFERWSAELLVAPALGCLAALGFIGCLRAVGHLAYLLPAWLASA